MLAEVIARILEMLADVLPAVAVENLMRLLG